ncbi:hypothetical protein PVAND_009082 [Polypedilum vanderplanki]|uniref:Ketimine reductase mu-crystallin n=1 Tax=Polypedilum vanderplanki TaxID=319348 RepID=A0A9J6CC03_POLVA|nr:hypothetical protein PVAND_009082 [Polypedilum vanderplanki]
MNSQQQNEKEEKDKRKQQHDNDVLFIKESVVRKLLNWNDCVDAMESALVAMSSASSSLSSTSSSSSSQVANRDEPFSYQTPRTFTMAGNDGVLLTMPGYAANYTLSMVTGNNEKHSTLACKLVTSFAKNSQLNPPLPTILATILLFNSSTGKLKAIVDGTDITAWRTASVSLVATKYLHRPQQNSILAIVGTGTQGRIHALAMLNYFPNAFTRINLWNRTKARADCLRDELNELFPEVEIVVVDTSVECVIDADCIVTATNSPLPLFELKDLKEDVHINAIGAGINHHSELPMEIYQFADVFIESNVGIQTELKGIAEFINGEIGEIIVGRKHLDDASGKRRTVFQSMGNAIEDGIMANLIYQKFIEL